MKRTFFDRFRLAIYNFMRGRYGNDYLNMTLLSLGIFFWILNIFLRNVALLILINIIIVYTLYRSFSKNIWTRQKENLRFLDATKGIRNEYKVINLNLNDKQSKYFVCPRCKQLVKVPRGKGKIEISCPRCKSKFDRKS